MAFNTELKAVTGQVRVRYTHLTAASSPVPGAAPKFSVTLMIPKSDTKTKAALDKAVAAATAEKFGTAGLPKTANPVYKDGDVEMVHKNDGGVDHEKNPEYEGHWVITASCKEDKPPHIIGAGNRPIPPAEVYPGCYAQVAVIAFGYDTAGNQGIGFNLQAVKKKADGEPFGGVYDPSMDFGDDDEFSADDLLG